MSRAAFYLLSIASLTVIFVFFIFPQSSSFSVDEVHSKHHNDNHKLLESPGERKIDKQELHLGEDNVIDNGEQEETTTKQKQKVNTHNNENHDEEEHHNHEEESNNNNKFHRTSSFRPDLIPQLIDKQPLLPKKILELYAGSVMPKNLGVYLKIKNTDNNNHDGAAVTSENGPLSKYQEKCPEWQERDSPSNTQFAIVFSRILREKFPPEKGGALDGSGLHWFLDEGGLIGTSRAGALRNADDDFDFFLLLPNLIAPCRPDSLSCTPEEYNDYIHKFLMVFHEEGMCINKFSPNPKKFKSRGRLMYSFQLNRGNADPENCFIEKKPFAHMHLGIFNEQGEVCTNVWIPSHSTHIKDKLHLDDMLPVSRCRAGPVDVPCPQNITGFLTVRNGGEYRKRSSDGSCLIVKKKWGALRKKNAAKTLKALDECGYNSIVDLLPDFEASGYTTC